MNKNDLRYLKTEKGIHEAYLALLAEKQTDSITVAALCRKAMINKTTFYNHYETMDALHTSVCTAFVEETVTTCPGIAKAYCDPEEGVHELVKTLTAKADVLSLLFAGDLPYLINLIEDCLLRIYLQNVDSPAKAAAICFAIGGAARVLLSSQSVTCDNAEKMKLIIDLIKKVL